MSHHIYRTDAIVLRTREWGEANRLITLLTREFGVIRALAQSVRLERSRLRYSLEPLTELSVSLVRGRELWRITGARVNVQWYYRLQSASGAHARAARVASLLERLMPEEGEGTLVYEQYRALLSRADAPEYAHTYEAYAVLELLATLGYVSQAERARFAAYIESIHEAPVPEKEYRGLLRTINEALEASQL